MEIFLIIIIGLAVYAAIATPIKRHKVQCKCPKCGHLCNASPWGTSLQYEKTFKCPICGHKWSTFQSMN